MKKQIMSLKSVNFSRRILNHLLFLFPPIEIVTLLTALGMIITKRRSTDLMADFTSAFWQSQMIFGCLYIITMLYLVFRDSNLYFEESGDSLIFSWPIFKKQYSVKKSDIIGINIIPNGLALAWANRKKDRIGLMLFTHTHEKDLELLIKQTGLTKENILITKSVLFPKIEEFKQYYRQHMNQTDN